MELTVVETPFMSNSAEDKGNEDRVIRIGKEEDEEEDCNCEDKEMVSKSLILAQNDFLVG